MRRIRHSRALLVGVLIASTGLFGEVALASADQTRSLPAGTPTSADGSALDRIEVVNDRQLMMYVRSAAMDKVIPLRGDPPSGRQRAATDALSAQRRRRRRRFGDLAD